MKKMLLLVVLILTSMLSSVTSAADWLGLQPEESSPRQGAITIHSALWVDGSISHEQCIACVEDFIPNAPKHQDGYNKFFLSYADQFYYQSLAFGLDPRYVFCLGISESSYGTSEIANSKNNLFSVGEIYDGYMDGYMAFSYDSVPSSIFAVCEILNEYAAEGSIPYQSILNMGYNPQSIEGQQAYYAGNNAAQVLSLMDEIFPCKWEVVVKFN